MRLNNSPRAYIMNNKKKTPTLTPRSGVKILTRHQIRDYAAQHADDPLSRDIVRMAEERRRSYYQVRRRKKRKPKKYLRPTDYLSLEQVAKILDYLKTRKSRTINRAVINEMIVVMLLETGMRAFELCNLRLSGLPSYHGKLEIEVAGKGRKDRTIIISEDFKGMLCEYVRRYHHGHGLESLLFRNERGKKMTRWSIYAKVKRIGINAGIWLYRKEGVLKTRLSPHKLRHTFATHLLDVTDNMNLVMTQLGHVKIDTTAIYARTLSEKSRVGMNRYSKRIGVVKNSEKGTNI